MVSLKVTCKGQFLWKAPYFVDGNLRKLHLKINISLFHLKNNHHCHHEVVKNGKSLLETKIKIAVSWIYEEVINRMKILPSSVFSEHIGKHALGE